MGMLRGMERRRPPSWSCVGPVEGRTGCGGRGGDDQTMRLVSPYVTLRAS